MGSIRRFITWPFHLDEPCTCVTHIPFKLPFNEHHYFLGTLPPHSATLKMNEVLIAVLGA